MSILQIQKRFDDESSNICVHAHNDTPKVDPMNKWYFFNDVTYTLPLKIVLNILELVETNF